MSIPRAPRIRNGQRQLRELLVAGRIQPSPPPGGEGSRGEGREREGMGGEGGREGGEEREREGMGGEGEVCHR